MESFACSGEQMHMYLVMPKGCTDLASALNSARTCVYRVTKVEPGWQEPWDEARTLQQIHEMLRELGVSNRLGGYPCLVQAIALTARNPLLCRALTKELYPMVASRLGISPATVERGIRYAVEQAFARCSAQVAAQYFGGIIHPQRGKPTSGEFIAELAYRLRQPLSLSVGVN